MTTQLTKKSITVTIADYSDILQTFDQNIMVCPGPNGYASITSYTPSYDGHNGAIKNNRGSNELSFDTISVQLPVKLYPGDTLVISKESSIKGGVPHAREAYWPGVWGRSDIDEMISIVCTPYNYQDTNLFRAPALGDNFLSRFFRSSPIPLSMLNLDKLPKVIPYDKVQQLTNLTAEQFIDYLATKFSDFSGDLYSEWSTDTRTPDLQNPGYGTYFAGLVSHAMVALCLNIDNQLKATLARNLVQWGLDYAGAWADGRYMSLGGGHGQGRKALLILAGHLLGIEPLATPNRFLGPVFQEDNAYYHASPAWWFGWEYGWDCFNMADRFLATQPSTWTNNGHGSEAWRVASYMPQVVGCQIGTVLGMKLMGRSNDFGLNITGMVTQWMTGPTNDQNNKLKDIGIDLPWKKSYAVGLHPYICSEVWQYGS